MPLPDSIVEHEIEHRRESLERDLDQAGLTLEAYAESRQITAADVEKELADDVRRSVKARFILDQLAEQENVSVEQDEIAQYLAQIAYQQGVPPDQLARQLTSSGQLAAVISDVLRSKTADLLAERVKVTDASGRKVVIGREANADLAEAGDDAGEPAGAGDEPAESAEGGEQEEAAAAAPAAKGKGRGRRSR